MDDIKTILEEQHDATGAAVSQTSRALSEAKLDHDKAIADHLETRRALAYLGASESTKEKVEQLLSMATHALDALKDAAELVDSVELSHDLRAEDLLRALRLISGFVGCYTKEEVSRG